MRKCLHCQADIIGPPDRPLDATPHRLAIWASDGTKLTAREIRAGAQGHHQHICAAKAAATPAPADDQLALDI